MCTNYSEVRFAFSEETTGEMSYHLRLGDNNRIYWDFIENKNSKALTMSQKVIFGAVRLLK